MEPLIAVLVANEKIAGQLACLSCRIEIQSIDAAATQGHYFPIVVDAYLRGCFADLVTVAAAN